MHGKPSVKLGLHPHNSPATELNIAHPSNPSWGLYRCRAQTRGISICAFDCVGDGAVRHTVRTVERMLANVHQDVIDRMASLQAQVAIIGRDQNTTDIPAHWILKGRKCEDGRDYDLGTRGLGGTIANPVTSVGEENVTMVGDEKYPSESILVHEFAHAVMNIGLAGRPERHAIVDAYETAIAAGLHDADSYLASNEDEYWAEGTQAWFHATVRMDVTSGMVTRAVVRKKDPGLAAALQAVWGNGRWRYPHTAPKSFKSHGRSHRKRRSVSIDCCY